MSKILHQIKRRYQGKIRIFITFDCPLNCNFCFIPNDMPKFKYRKPEEWAEAINRIGRNVIFTGGEPTRYKGFTKLINAIDTDITIHIYSNLTFDVENFCSEVNRGNMGFWLSYHKCYGDVNKYIEKFKVLKKHFGCKVHYILDESQANDYPKYERIFKSNGIELKPDFIADDLSIDLSDYDYKKVVCYKNDVFIAPNGNRHQCITHMKKGVHSLGNVIDDRLKLDGTEKTLVCEYAQECMPADLRCECIVRGI